MKINEMNLKEWISKYTKRYDDLSLEYILNSLEILDLSDCNVNEIHPDIEKVKGIIDLSKNNIKEIPNINLLSKSCYSIVPLYQESTQNIDKFYGKEERIMRKIMEGKIPKNNKPNLISLALNPIEKIHNPKLVPIEIKRRILQENFDRIDRRGKEDKFIKECKDKDKK